ncbi:HB2L protein, partial [Pitta sordida]|nr:HB2L protein [Pitta sordida]
GGHPLTCGPADSGVFQWMGKVECHFINGINCVRFMVRQIYNREQYLHFDSDVGEYVGDTPYGEIQARYRNSQPEFMECAWTAVDWYCRNNYKGVTPFSVERRVPHSPDQSIP